MHVAIINTKQLDKLVPNACISLANDCGPLANPNNGTVTLVNGTLLGSVAIYTCDLGYGVDGDVTRRCQGNKSWSGQSSCQGTLVYMKISNLIQNFLFDNLHYWTTI